MPHVDISTVTKYYRTGESRKTERMNLYIKETKYWLSSDATLKDSAKFFNCSSTTFLNRSIRTLSRLVNYFDF